MSKINCLINTLRITGKEIFSRIEIERTAHECERAFIKDEVRQKEQELKDIEYHLQNLKEEEKRQSIEKYFSVK